MGNIRHSASQGLGTGPFLEFFPEKQVVRAQVEYAAIQGTFSPGSVDEVNFRFLVIHQPMGGPPQGRLQGDKIRKVEIIHFPFPHEIRYIDSERLFSQAEFLQESVVTINDVLSLVQEQDSNPA